MERVAVQKTLSGSTASESGTPQSHQPKRSRRSSSRLLSESLCEITAIEPEVLVSLSELLSTHLHSLGSITSSFTRLNNRVYANRMDLSQSLTELSVSPQHLLDSFYQWIALSATQSLNSFSTSQEDEKTSFMSSSSLLGKRKPTTYLPSEEQANRVEKLEWINTLPQLPKLPPPHTYRLSQIHFHPTESGPVEREKIRTEASKTQKSLALLLQKHDQVVADRISIAPNSNLTETQNVPATEDYRQGLCANYLIRKRKAALAGF